MNPFEAPQASLKVPIEIGDQRAINWGAICVAGLVDVISTILIYTLGAVLEHFQIYATAPVQVVAFFTPWVLGAFYLAWRIRRRWLAHGMIYSAIPPLVTMIGAALQHEAGLLIIIFTPIALVFSVVITLVTMSLSRLLISDLLQLKKQLSR